MFGWKVILAKYGGNNMRIEDLTDFTPEQARERMLKIIDRKLEEVEDEREEIARIPESDFDEEEAEERLQELYEREQELENKRDEILDTYMR